MTQKEKIARASQFCYMVKSISNSIASACRDYDESWAFQYTKQLTENADSLLKMLKKQDPNPSPLSPHFIYGFVLDKAQLTKDIKLIKVLGYVLCMFNTNPLFLHLK